MSLLQNSNAISAAGGYNITDSLRIRSAASAYLTRTFTSSGTQTTWTYSAWVKRGKLGTNQAIFSAGINSSNFDSINFTSTDALYFSFGYGSVITGAITTSAVFRDPSAWYHIVAIADTTNATAADRMQLFVNGVRQTVTINTQVAQNYATSYITDAVEHRISSRRITTPDYYFDGHMTEVNLVDGQALDPSYFGETNADGVWSPKEYTGTYGTNGFYLPMKETTQATGFNTVLYQGTGAAQSITGVGFNPDLVWIKNRDRATSHVLTDSVRGVGKHLRSESTGVEIVDADFITSFDSDGFSIGSSVGTGDVNYYAGEDYAAWCWDAGSSTVSNTDGSITSSVRANPATGFSVVTYTGTGSTATVGHGLGTAPKMMIIKSINGVSDWGVYHESLGNTGAMFLNGTQAFTTAAYFNNTSPDADKFTVLGGVSWCNNTSSSTHVAYCFSEVSGYSKFGSYTGNGSTSGPTVTTGFRPAFVLIKNATTGGLSWVINDNTRSEGKDLSPNASDAESTPSPARLTFTDTGFTLTSSANSVNQSGATHIYMAFKDTRDFQWNFDASGNKNNWTPNNINSNASSETTYDLMSDVPFPVDEDTGNFATLNALAAISTKYPENGNLTTFTPTIGTVWMSYKSTLALPSTGKWYFEMYVEIGGYGSIGILDLNKDVYNSGSTAYIGGANTGLSYGYVQNGKIYNGETNTDYAYGAAYTTGDTIGCAYSADDNTLEFFKNGVSQGSFAVSAPINEYYFGISKYQNNDNSANFGQRPFAYTPPTGYKKLNTFNLPDSSITDGSDYFDANVWTGNGSTQKITTEYSPDLLWIKVRSSSGYSHVLYDTIRGASKYLVSNSSGAEGDDSNAAITSFDSDGYTLNSAAYVNANTASYVGWSWRGSDSTAVSNSEGTITSTVSANPTSGFSVVTYTGNATNSTVGHGLGQTPSMIIVKCRDNAQNWGVWHKDLSASANVLLLNSTSAQLSRPNFFNSGSHSPTTFNLGVDNATNDNGNNHVAYVFADVEGFSKFGSYTGNGSADGPFVYTGFRPAFVLFKNADGANNWYLSDNAREPENPIDYALYPNVDSAESSATNYDLDFVSNGFKIKNTGTYFNANGNNIIYMAFAENPFKNSLAR